MPLTCKGRDTWGGYKLTLIDTMDTLLLTGDLRRFRKVEQIVRAMSFDIDKVINLQFTNFLRCCFLRLFKIKYYFSCILNAVEMFFILN